MSRATVAMFINTQPFTNIRPRTLLSSHTFRTLTKPALSRQKSFRIERTVAAGTIETKMVADGDDKRISSPTSSALKQETLIDNDVYASFHQIRAGGIHGSFNSMSKWLVGVTLVGLIVLRRDALALWGATGSVLNYMLAIILKQIVKQERPVPGVHLGPGMPSSHGQSIFYVLVFVILSVVEWQGLNGVTALFGMLVVALSSYFSWLRVFFTYHTTSQVVVGAITGSLFSVLWFWSWEAIIYKSYNSNLWVRIIVAVGAASCLLELVTKGYQAFALANR
uniref:lipid phosphate phosphatase epsilon 1, chloroplastic-like n=1 Tax=Erigeron canadensis TaxID=72917 RepID=UPI001CB9849E|nr:lipid phosphate phosphatase epsilon 1, chloroplastic-like [Erigeron canadensis]